MKADDLVDFYRMYIDCMLSFHYPPEGVELAGLDYIQHLDPGRNSDKKPVLDGPASSLLRQYRLLVHCLKCQARPSRVADLADAIADYLATSGKIEPDRHAWFTRQFGTTEGFVYASQVDWFNGIVHLWRKAEQDNGDLDPEGVLGIGGGFVIDTSPKNPGEGRHPC